MDPESIRTPNNLNLSKSPTQDFKRVNLKSVKSKDSISHTESIVLSESPVKQQKKRQNFGKENKETKGGGRVTRQSKWEEQIQSPSKITGKDNTKQPDSKTDKPQESDSLFNNISAINPVLAEGDLSGPLQIASPTNQSFLAQQLLTNNSVAKPSFLFKSPNLKGREKDILQAEKGDPDEKDMMMPLIISPSLPVIFAPKTLPQSTKAENYDQARLILFSETKESVENIGRGTQLRNRSLNNSHGELGNGTIQKTLQRSSSHYNGRDISSISHHQQQMVLHQKSERLENELFKSQSNFRKQEGIYQKQVAVLEQQLGQLKIEMAESRKREEKQRNLYRRMLFAINQQLILQQESELDYNVSLTTNRLQLIFMNLSNVHNIMQEATDVFNNPVTQAHADKEIQCLLTPDPIDLISQLQQQLKEKECEIQELIDESLLNNQQNRNQRTKSFSPSKEQDLLKKVDKLQKQVNEQSEREQALKELHSDEIKYLSDMHNHQVTLKESKIKELEAIVNKLIKKPDSEQTPTIQSLYGNKLSSLKNPSQPDLSKKSYLTNRRSSNRAEPSKTVKIDKNNPDIGSRENTIDLSKTIDKKVKSQEVQCQISISQEDDQIIKKLKEDMDSLKEQLEQTKERILIKTQENEILKEKMKQVKQQVMKLEKIQRGDFSRSRSVSQRVDRPNRQSPNYKVSNKSAEPECRQIQMRVSNNFERDTISSHAKKGPKVSVRRVNLYGEQNGSDTKPRSQTRNVSAKPIEDLNLKQNQNTVRAKSKKQLIVKSLNCLPKLEITPVKLDPAPQISDRLSQRQREARSKSRKNRIEQKHKQYKTGMISALNLIRGSCENISKNPLTLSRKNPLQQPSPENEASSSDMQIDSARGDSGQVREEEQREYNFDKVSQHRLMRSNTKHLQHKPRQNLTCRNLIDQTKSSQVAKNVEGDKPQIMFKSMDKSKFSPVSKGQMRYRHLSKQKQDQGNGDHKISQMVNQYTEYHDTDHLETIDRMNEESECLNITTGENIVESSMASPMIGKFKIFTQDSPRLQTRRQLDSQQDTGRINLSLKRITLQVMEERAKKSTDSNSTKRMSAPKERHQPIDLSFIKNLEHFQLVDLVGKLQKQSRKLEFELERTKQKLKECYHDNSDLERRLAELTKKYQKSENLLSELLRQNSRFEKRLRQAQFILNEQIDESFSLHPEGDSNKKRPYVEVKNDTMLLLSQHKQPPKHHSTLIKVTKIEPNAQACSEFVSGDDTLGKPRLRDLQLIEIKQSSQGQKTTPKLTCIDLQDGSSDQLQKQEATNKSMSNQVTFNPPLKSRRQEDYKRNSTRDDLIKLIGVSSTTQVRDEQSIDEPLNTKKSLETLNRKLTSVEDNDAPNMMDTFQSEFSRTVTQKSVIQNPNIFGKATEQVCKNDFKMEDYACVLIADPASKSNYGLSNPNTNSNVTPEKLRKRIKDNKPCSQIIDNSKPLPDLNSPINMDLNCGLNQVFNLGADFTCQGNDLEDTLKIVTHKVPTVNSYYLERPSDQMREMRSQKGIDPSLVEQLSKYQTEQCQLLSNLGKSSVVESESSVTDGDFKKKNGNQKMLNNKLLSNFKFIKLDQRQKQKESEQKQMDRLLQVSGEGVQQDQIAKTQKLQKKRSQKGELSIELDTEKVRKLALERQSREEFERQYNILKQKKLSNTLHTLNTATPKNISHYASCLVSTLKTSIVPITPNTSNPQPLSQLNSTSQKEISSIKPTQKSSIQLHAQQNNSRVRGGKVYKVDLVEGGSKKSRNKLSQQSSVPILSPHNFLSKQTSADENPLQTHSDISHPDLEREKSPIVTKLSGRAGSNTGLKRQKAP